MGLDLARLNGLDAPLPRVSVIVRSYNRLHALVELLTALLAQDHDSFEVVVVEQSTQRAPEDVARLDALFPPGVARGERYGEVAAALLDP
jgi:GT2 family glycosyltransferase